MADIGKDIENRQTETMGQRNRATVPLPFWKNGKKAEKFLNQMNKCLKALKIFKKIIIRGG